MADISQIVRLPDGRLGGTLDAHGLRNAEVLDRQRRLLEVEVPDIPGYEFHLDNRPCLHVGGDYVDLLPCEGRIVLVLGDVCGKGIDAAILMATIPVFTLGFALLMRREKARRMRLAGIVTESDFVAAYRRTVHEVREERDSR